MSFYYASFNNKGFVKLYSYCSTRVPPPQDITTFIFIFIFMSRCCSYLYFHRTCASIVTISLASNYLSLKVRSHNFAIFILINYIYILIIQYFLTHFCIFPIHKKLP